MMMVMVSDGGGDGGGDGGDDGGGDGGGSGGDGGGSGGDGDVLNLRRRAPGTLQAKAVKA